MNRTVVAALAPVAAVEAATVALGRPDLLVRTAAVVTAATLLIVYRLIAAGDPAAPAETAAVPSDPDLVVARWLAGTRGRIHFAESTRADWDRRWRPVLARRFELSTGQRRTGDPAEYRQVGVMLFGERLWGWVDPGDVGGDGPGPGRAVLEEILRRLEQR